jgi:putative ABC transport system permease protein
MKYLPLVWCGLWRKRVRTALTMLSVSIAFWLYGTLDGVTAAFGDSLASMTSAVRLRTQSRLNFRTGLPLAYRARIEGVAGVRDVGVLTYVGGYYRDSVDFIEVAAIDIRRVDTTPTSSGCARCERARSSVPSSCDSTAGRSASG